MDPLASVVGVVKLAAHIARALDDLRTLCKQLPGRVHALSNEVSDIEVVLIQVAKVLQERACSPISTAETDNKSILQLLVKAEIKLKELKLIVDGLSASSKQNNVIIFRAGLWRKEQPRLLALQEDIKAIKSSLNVVLGASNSRDMMRVRLDIETLSVATTQSVQSQTASLHEFLRGMTLQHKEAIESVSEKHQLVDERISRIEEMLRAQSEQIQTAQFTQIGPSYDRTRPQSQRRYSRPWALYGQQYETCKFLLMAGADTEYRPISVNDDCPSDKACDIILRGGVSEKTLEILRYLAAGSDFVDSQNFAPIHKIVLKLSLHDLEEEILRDPDDVDIPDANGRTALEWAAARGDDRAVTMLLSYGAEPNVMDKKLNTPLTLASNQNQTVCVRLLLEAGAIPDPILPAGIKFGSPLNCAARNASDPLLLKTLLDFNANIEASGVDGVTPLLHVARGNSASHAMLLLEYGAEINVTSKDGRTPLTTAIVYNNHNFLRLLLDRLNEYSECPRLKGPHLLSLVAQYADIQTISILTSTDHLKLKFDRDYILGDFATRLQQRVDVTEKLVDAFEDLLCLINQGSVEGGSIESRMESGLLTAQGFNSPTSSSEESDDVFEDAQESIGPQACPPFRLEKRSTI
ncbi:hypothetical protein VE00_02263 [Pseudogymnoascus sp. WSF 3629]|nr:hypothetical protein VE00_02263 [Pseudogymnoascus sp. WSF 3629]